MTMQKLFDIFDSKIRLTQGTKAQLRRSRNALRKKVKEYEQNGKRSVPRFYGQGSFYSNTIINPIPVADGDKSLLKYDLDDGVYFEEEKRKEPQAYHTRVLNAVRGHAQSEQDKNTCVRVKYADGHHIDLPVYHFADGEKHPNLAHKGTGWTVSDPKEFREWLDGKLKDNPQLLRTIRYLKAWKNYREDCNGSLKMPSGLILTILGVSNFTSDASDDIAFQKSITSIRDTLKRTFVCNRPTTPTDEDLLSDYTSKETLLKELDNAVDNATAAISEEKVSEASGKWRKVFGDRFPEGKDVDGSSNGKAAPVSAAAIGVQKPWLA